MSGQIVPKRFGLKYSPKPAIALEYQKPDSGLAILEVIIEQLSPETFDVEGVVDALQKKHPFHLGPSLVSANQLERLVSRLLFEGRAHLPEEYPTPTGMIVDKTQPQSSPFGGASSLSKPDLLPKADDDDTDHSGGLSNGPTPAPTPDMEHVARDPSDGGSVTSDPLHPEGGGFDSLGGEEEKSGAPADAALGKESNEDEGRQQLSTTVALNTPAAGLRSDSYFEGREDEEENGAAGEEGDGERRRREPEGKHCDQDGGGARNDAEEESKGGAESSLSSAGSETNTKENKRNETLRREGGGFDDHREIHRESKGGGQRRGSEGEVHPLPTSPKTIETSASARVTTTTAATLDRESSLENDPEDAFLREPSTEKGQREEQKKEQVEEISSVEEEDDDIPEDVESEEYYQAGGSAISREEYKGDKKGHEGHDGSEQRREGMDDDEGAPGPVALGGVDGIAVGRAGAAEREDDHTEDGLDSPRTTEREAGDSSGTPPPAASPPSPSKNNSPTLLAGAGEGGSPRLLSPPLASPRDLASMPSSPPGEARASLSSLAGLPLPPMAGARQRLGLLGSLPPVGGRGLPSLALPVGKRTGSAGEEQEGGTSRAGRGEARDDNKDAAVIADALLSGNPSKPPPPPPSSSVPSPAGPFAAAESEPAALSKPFRPSQSPSMSKEGRVETNIDDDAAADDGDNDGNHAGGGSDAHDLAPLSPTEGIEGVGEQDEKAEEAALRARLGLGLSDDEHGDDDDDDDDDEDKAGRDTDEEDGVRGAEDDGTPSSLGSPKQHQGQEEENAGRTSSGIDLGVAPVGGGDGGDYFGDLTQVDELGEDESIDEDMSFEQESVGSDGGGDYFS